VQPLQARTFLVPMPLPNTGGLGTLDDALDEMLVGTGVLMIAGGLALAYVRRRNAA